MGSEPVIYVKDMYVLDGIKYSLYKQGSLVFVDPQPKNIAAMYSDEYFDEDYASDLQAQDYESSSFTKRFDKLLELLPKGGKLLEIGCASGHFLNCAKQHSFKTYGIEINPKMAEKARMQGHSVYCENFITAQLDKKFDVIYMGHVLEHMTNPNMAVRKARQLLNKDGLLLIDVPGYVNSSFYKPLLLLNKIVKLPRFFKMPGVWKPYHLWEFNKKSLNNLIESNEMQVLYCKGYLNPLNKGNNFLKLIFFIANKIINITGWQAEGITLLAKK